MALAKIYSAAVIGLDCQVVTVEVDIANKGLASFQIVGLPDTAINESKERVRSAIINSSLKFPTKRITVNLAPADLAKSGPIYDLPIAIGILLASGQLTDFPAEALVVGELALDGNVRAVSGVLPITIMTQRLRLGQVFIPSANTDEASLVEEVKIVPVDCLADFLEPKNQNSLTPGSWPLKKSSADKIISPGIELDFSLIKGQLHAKRALEIAASGGHNVLLHGPPGSGKTLLAKSLISIMPRMSKKEILEVTQIYSISGFLTKERPIISERPFRSPHHSASAVSLVGGGSQPKPGEITLAHRGILFLDELPEFHRDVLESLRQPLEDRTITVARANSTCRFPADFLLLAAYNPCPCGNLYDPKLVCQCTQGQIIRYQKKLSGPLLDRIDLHVEVPRVKTKDLLVPRDNSTKYASSVEIRARVEKARSRQKKRFTGTELLTNSEMGPKEIERFCFLSPECQSLIKAAIDRLNLSARTYHRILKVARTIGDLEDNDEISEASITEALQYRPNSCD